MISGKAIFELYEYLKTIDKPHLAKHSVSAIVLCLLEDLEQSGKPITAEAIDAAFQVEFDRYELADQEKKVS